jgi:hypothetical protein
MSKEIVTSADIRPDALPAIVARADDLLRLWIGNLEAMPLDDLKDLKLICESSIENGEPARIAHLIRIDATEKDIGLALMNLIGSFIQGKETDLKLFGANLARDVIDAKPTLMALHATCTHLRKTRDFMPSIKMVLETLDEKQKACESRAQLLDKLQSRVGLASEIINGRTSG